MMNAVDGGRRTVTRTTLAMGTIVNVHVSTVKPDFLIERAMDRVSQVFRDVEHSCSRFDASSELSQLCRSTGVFVPVSDMLFEAVRFAIEVAKATDGLFDPTVGQTMSRLGFNRHYLTGAVVMPDLTGRADYRDVELDEDRRQIRLAKPLLLDLGAVAKGFAIDLAAQTLQGFEGFVVDAGGDLYVSGTNHHGEAWHVGIQHPVDSRRTICNLRLTDTAICTSGNYERKSPVVATAHHIVDAKTGISPVEVVSCTAIAPYAMMADAFSTASLLLGVEHGINLLEALGLEGLWITSDLEVHTTNQFTRYQYE